MLACSAFGIGLPRRTSFMVYMFSADSSRRVPNATATAMIIGSTMS